MEHFLAYHSTQRMGSEYEPNGDLCFRSKKHELLKKSLGNTVWVIQGISNRRKTTYTLRGCYLADRFIAEVPASDTYIIFGSPIMEFATPILLNDLSWFPALLESQANFSLGFNQIGDESVVHALIELQTGSTNSSLVESAIVAVNSDESHLALGDNWYSAQEYQEAILRLGDKISPLQRRMLAAHAESPERTLSVRQLATAGGYDKPNITYSQYGRLGRLIADSLGELEQWNVWTNFIGSGFRTHTGELIWEMHMSLAEALVKLGWASRVGAPDVLDDITEVSEDTEFEGSETERDTLIQARIGQGQFRSDLLRYWGSCAVTRISEPAVLRASHIKPWRIASNRERVDAYNGLLLAAHIDALFDAGLITFETDGRIRLSPLLAEEDRKQLGIEESMRLRHIATEHEAYLVCHRKLVFRTGS